HRATVTCQNATATEYAPMAPHGIYACNGEDEWIAISCRDDHDWTRFAEIIGERWCSDQRYAVVVGRLQHEDELDLAIDAVTRARDKFDLAARLQSVGVPATAVQKPAERVDNDPRTANGGL